MKVVLVQCPVWGTSEPPLGIVQLSGHLKKCGYEVKSFDLNNFLYRNRKECYKNLWAWEQSLFWYNKKEVSNFFCDIKDVIDDYINSILEEKPSVVGFSVSASSYCATVELANRLKQKDSSINIVFGGQVFYDKKRIELSFIDSAVDYIILGEGENSFVQLLQYLEKNFAIKECKGIFFKENGEVKFTGKNTLIKNLDELAYMDFSDLKVGDYDNVEHIVMMTTRGCIWGCYFCSSRNFWTGYREMSAERIHQEIIYHRLVSKKNFGHIDFVDLVFNANVERIKNFCELMIKYPPFLDNGKIYWLANAIINPNINYELFCMMKEAGCKMLIFGIESGSQKVLDLMNKPYKISDAKRVIKDASKAGIFVTTNFMFGFPGETEEDFQETLNFLDEMAPYINRVYPSRTYCALEELSYIYNFPEKFNIKTPFNHHLYWETVDGNNNYPIRLHRCKLFEEKCNKLEIEIDCGVKTSPELDEWYNLGNYYEYTGDYLTACKYFEKYIEKVPNDKIVSTKITKLKNKLNICVVKNK